MECQMGMEERRLPLGSNAAFKLAWMTPVICIITDVHEIHQVVDTNTCNHLYFLLKEMKKIVTRVLCSLILMSGRNRFHWCSLYARSSAFCFGKSRSLKSSLNSARFSLWSSFKSSAEKSKSWDVPGLMNSSSQHNPLQSHIFR
ncbi:hypothetical protein TNCT_88681 [Trichonephila clavata]|uniref:Uncharacterized protein n=1 Tax=Trichonephila clavata TaxID=2740835 RepID=A0A8X6EXS7_TRICU|nr:hypothetical protein TNCT_88681 [Trichonephila clavata]